MFQDIYYEDYQVGSVRETVGRTITETDVVMHAGQTGDFFPHHMDAEWCKTTDVGQRIAHGTLVFSVGVGMTASVINPVAFSYGYDKLRFIRPVFINDTIRVKVTIKDKYPSPKHAGKGFVVENVQVFNQHGQLCLTADHLLLCEMKEPAAADAT